MSHPPYSTSGTYWDIEAIGARLKDARIRWRAGHSRNAEHGAVGFPSHHDLRKIMISLCGALFPLRLGPTFIRADNEDAYVKETLQTALSRIYGQIRLELAYSLKDASPHAVDADAARIISHFADALPDVRAMLDQNVEAAFEGDPAAQSVDEILICYPGIQAIIHHRLAHLLHGLGAPLVARIIAEIANSDTGIDIHPGARIGRRFFIDHGTGVVIGETAIIGDGVRLYQAVTLGARSLPSAVDGVIQRGLARHPIIEDDVVIYAGATLLGRIVIGRGSVIGGNVWLTESIPPGSFVNQATVRKNGVRAATKTWDDAQPSEAADGSPIARITMDEQLLPDGPTTR